MNGRHLNAAYFRLVSTPSSKYAHLPARLTGEPSWWGVTACNQPLPTYDPNQLAHDRYANGKPPCPKCAGRLRWRINYLAEFEESYLMLEDEWAALPEANT